MSAGIPSAGIPSAGIASVRPASGGRAAPLAASALVALLGLFGCGPTRAAAPPPEYPGRLAPPASLRSPPGLGEAFALEQRVRAESREGAHEFRAVLQRLGGRLVLVGFGPHGGRGFVLQQEGNEVEFESHMPAELPFPPRFMLHDIQRVWFSGLDWPLPDGEHSEVVDDEEIVERWRDGRLLERSFRRLDGRPEGTLHVTYEGGLGPGGPPERTVVENGWFGYRLVLTTLSHQRIEAPPQGERSGVGASSSGAPAATEEPAGSPLPGEEPPGEEPPGDWPSAEEPPGEEPPGEEPPGEEPPGEEPPGDWPSAEEPPGEEPPGEEPAR